MAQVDCFAQEIEMNKVDEINNYVYSNHSSAKVDLQQLVLMAKGNIARAEKLQYYLGLAEAYRVLAIVYAYTGQSGELLSALRKAEEIAEKNELDKEILVNIINVYVGYYTEVKRQYAKATEYCQRGLKIAKQYKLHDLNAKLTMNFGIICMRMELYKDSLAFLQTALAYYQISGDRRLRMFCYSNIANCYYLMGNKDKSLVFHNQSRQLAEELQDAIILSTSTKGLAQIAFENGERQKACEMLEKALEMLYENGQKGWEIDLSLALFNFYLQCGEMHKISDMLPRLETLVIDLDNADYLATFYKYKAQYMEQQDNYSQAYLSLKQFYLFHKRKLQEQTKDEIDNVRTEIMEETIRRLRIISEIGREITSIINLEDIFEAVYLHVNNLMDAANLAIGILEDDRVNYVYYNRMGKRIDTFTVPLTNPNSFGNWSILHNDSITINDMDIQSEKYIKEYQFYGPVELSKVPQSMLVTPLKVNDEVIGVIHLQSYKKNSYQTDNVEIFNIIASYAAIAIKNSMQTEELNELAIKDSMTGLYNWRYFHQRMGELLIGNQKNQSSITLIIIDIDHFKKVNDTYGHGVGNICLQRVALKIKESFAEFNSICSRIGGEEFSVIIIDEDKQVIEERAQIFVQEIKRSAIDTDCYNIQLTVSLGLSYKPVGVILTPEKFFVMADNALYKAKIQGRNCVAVNEDDVY